MTPEEWEALADRVVSLIPRYLYVLQGVAGAVLLIVGYVMGHVHFRLIEQGVRAPGTVVAFQQMRIGNNANGHTADLAFMPIVEFRSGGKLVRFQDWKGSGSSGGRGNSVTVLYDPMRASDAMIDRPVWNWMPWAPIFALGVFLTFVATKGWLRAMLSG